MSVNMNMGQGFLVGAAFVLSDVLIKDPFYREGSRVRTYFNIVFKALIPLGAFLTFAAKFPRANLPKREFIGLFVSYLVVKAVWTFFAKVQEDPHQAELRRANFVLRCICRGGQKHPITEPNQAKKELTKNEIQALFTIYDLFENKNLLEKTTWKDTIWNYIDSTSKLNFLLTFPKNLMSPNFKVAPILRAELPDDLSDADREKIQGYIVDSE